MSSDGTSSSYRDYSRVPDDDTDSSSALAATHQGTKEPKFPVKLHMILSNPAFQDVISWLPHGRSWRIINQKKFETRVIPLFFRHSQFSSFARQVNGWGFRRITNGNDSNSYYHELFLRGMPHLCHKMKRLTPKDLALRKKTEDDPPPDFYELSRNNPLPESAPLPMSATAMPELPMSLLPSLQNFYRDSLNPTARAPLDLHELLLIRNNMSSDSAAAAAAAAASAAATAAATAAASGVGAFPNIGRADPGLCFSAGLQQPFMSSAMSGMGRNANQIVAEMALRHQLALNRQQANSDIARILGMNTNAADLANMNGNNPSQRNSHGR